MRISNRQRPPVRQLASLARHLAWIVRLPPRVALFYVRALLVALRTRDEWTAAVATRPRDLARLLRAAQGRRSVVELGTASAWTAAALALADRERRVVTLDPEVHSQRDRYLDLLDRPTRERIELIQARGEDGPTTPKGTDGQIDFLFMDGAHEREANVAAFNAWRPALAPGAIVALHDYGDPDYPGVNEAVNELGLVGEARGTLFLARPEPIP